MTLSETLEAAITAANLPETDLAGAELMRIYVTQIETAVNKRDTKTIGDIGAKLLATLTALGMTQAGRAVKDNLKGGVVTNDSTNSPASKLAGLRATASKRAGARAA